jgi:imidazolonepropionase-like amidohydrolase
MKGLLIENCALVDTAAGTVIPEAWVRTEGERIVEVDTRPIAAADGWRRIDARGKHLLPGLIDAHVHVAITTMNLAALGAKPISLVAHESRPIMENMLRRGFTTVRDAAGADWGLAEAVERGLIDGPRLFISGKALSQTGGHGDFRPRNDEAPLCACSIPSSGIAHVADGVPAVRKAAREELRRGAKQVKIMASGGVASPTDPVWNLQYSAEEMRAIVEEAHGWRTYAMAHAYTAEAVTRAVEAGVRTIEHGNLIDAATAKLMAERDAFLVPTLVTYYVIDEIGAALGFPAASQRKVRDVLDAGLSSLELAREAGVAIGFGTDLLGETHDQQSREFRIRREVLPAMDVLQSATTVNAEILGMEGELGVVAPGAFADLVLVDGDPVADIAVLENEARLALIAKAGRVVVDRL